MLSSDNSFLLLIDLQAKLLPAILDGDAVVQATERLLRVARLCHVPVRATEHCASSIGPTTSALRSLLNEDEILHKTKFAAGNQPMCRGNFNELGRHPVLVGTEAHVCVLQSALSLKAQGLDPCVVVDAIGSRYAEDKDTALQRLNAEGVTPVTSEMVMFEWAEDAESVMFRDILKIIKER